MSDNRVVAVGVGAFLAGLAVTTAIFNACDRCAPLRSAYVHDALVKAGHAEYYLDADNNRQWRLKPMPEKVNLILGDPRPPINAEDYAREQHR